MAERVRRGALDAARPATLARLAGLAVLVLLATTACSSDPTKTEVRGEVLTKDDPYLGGPNPVVSEFRAGERAVYGSRIASP